ncbi:MAG: hypothetical protein C7K11_07545 [Candidatus Amulumruptor caecigallinarius]|uniref:MotA/TolQ/ExbB proton channel family protein n=1 Tax=Candidatus Amulumruptor caecigallinarius TaxID=2109911 RepID=A0A4Q0U7Q5_9BACT|nr:MAG: hypothetical protein C7K11_07545 [Candidatus Amulumruptor caecigallinarius]HJE38442.1 MotA/TolQ/ExbB proton channel family protein [Candidatus Amulumruptor caecigallinarius]
MNVISNILFWISTGLLVPVIVLLIFFFIRALILIGGFMGQYMQTKKTTDILYKDIEKLSPQTLEAFEMKLAGQQPSVLKAFAEKIIANRGDKGKLELMLSEYEIEADKNLATSKVLTKMGPILGLMGTLIPMGPALVGLSTGDISSMAYNMQVAFATTVVGLVVSAIGFLTQMVKQRWAVKNLTILEYLADVVKQQTSKTAES